MKKCMKLAVTTVVMGCLLSFPAFAAEMGQNHKWKEPGLLEKKKRIVCD